MNGEKLGDKQVLGLRREAVARAERLLEAAKDTRARHDARVQLAHSWRALKALESMNATH